MTNELEQYLSLDDAFTRTRMPDRNRQFIRTFVESIGISAFYATTGYIKAVRASEGPDLRIASGWSNGFISEAEILAALGDVERWGNGDRAPFWGVSHPVHRIGHGGGGLAARLPRTYGACPDCFMEYSASGRCNCS